MDHDRKGDPGVVSRRSAKTAAVAPAEDNGAAAVQARSAAPPPAAAFAARPPASALASRLPGPPTPAFAARPPGPPPTFTGQPGAVQRHGSGGAFAVEAGQLGLAAGGGKPLPETVRSKMEAALGADFSAVRVHVGPQAERIGAIAFTMGTDIYFAPGRYRPDSVHGQQLLGHELAHVVQQRAGRVKNPLGSELAVVQDHALEAEADRLGRHAAAHRVAAQAKMPSVAAQPSAPVRISPPISVGAGSYRVTAGAGGRQVGSVMVHARDKRAVEVTDLGVDQTQRGHGIGRTLVASAAKTGLQFGKSKVMLAAQDKGSGHLTRWYKEMGFTQIGVNQRGYPQLEAPINRVLAGTAQRQVKQDAPSGPASTKGRSHPGVRSPDSRAGLMRMKASARAVQRMHGPLHSAFDPSLVVAPGQHVVTQVDSELGGMFGHSELFLETYDAVKNTVITTKIHVQTLSPTRIDIVKIKTFVDMSKMRGHRSYAINDSQYSAILVAALTIKKKFEDQYITYAELIPDKYAMWKQADANLRIEMSCKTFTDAVLIEAGLRTEYGGTFFNAPGDL